jgi:hypothetical protein
MRLLIPFRNSRASLFVVLASSALACGCGTRVSFTPTNAAPRAMKPRNADSVQIFTTQTPSRPYVEVGVIEAQQASAFSTADETQVVAKLRESAAQQGCDALIITGSADKVVGSNYTSDGNTTSTVTTLRGFRGTCILFDDAGKAPAANGSLTAAPPSAPPAAVAASSPAAVAPAPPKPAAPKPAAATTAAPASVVATAFSCTPGTTQQCVGPGGCKGGQACNDKGTAFTACDCGTQSARR